MYRQLHGVILIPVFPAWPALQGMAGVYYFGPMSSTRVVVFIDYQNVYHCARELFYGSERIPPSTGNVYPLEYGKMLCDLGLEKDPNRVLTGVRVYRGQPVPGKGHEKVCRSFDRQVAQWRKTPDVEVSTRPLRYYPAVNETGEEYQRGEEKGVDVMMALDIAIGATKGSYDVAIVATADTDFLPAVEHALAVRKRVETATWWAPKSPRGQLKVPNRNIWNHNLDKSKFDSVRDDTDYLVAP